MSKKKLTFSNCNYCAVIQIMLSNIGQKAISVTRRAASVRSARTVAKVARKQGGSVSARTIASFASSRGKMAQSMVSSHVRFHLLSI